METRRTAEQQKAIIDAIIRDDVLSVYTGRPGCMCGCRGRHTYHPAHRAEATTDRGYEVEANECSLGTVTRVLRGLQAAPGAQYDDGIIHADIGARHHVVYLTAAGRARVELGR